MAREMFTAEERAELDEQYESWKQSGEAANLIAGDKAKLREQGASKSLQ
jgi:hypothetical protein